MTSSLNQRDKKFVEKVKLAIKNDSFAKFGLENWEIIEELLEIIENYT